MPGGLCRVSPTIDTPVVSMQQGGGSKDTWVLSDIPVDNFTLRQPPDVPVKINRGESSDLPSRAADFLFWLGRYAERAEHMSRALRVILTRLTGESAVPGSPEWESMLKLHQAIRLRANAFSKTTPRDISILPANSNRKSFRSSLKSAATTASPPA